jgi:hypothetical protein
MPFIRLFQLIANLSGRAVQGVGLSSLAFWDYGLESRGVMNVGYFWLFRVVRLWPLRRADHSPIAVLQSVVCLNQCDSEASKMRKL